VKLNRNDVCHCGSGKKYKKCHMEADEARQRGRRNLTTLHQWVSFHTGSLVASVREAARSAEPVQAAFAELFDGNLPSDPLADPVAEQVALYDVVVGEHALITGGVNEELAAGHAESLRMGLARTWLSLHEVVQCKRGKGVRLRDRLLDRERWVGDPALAEKLQPMEVVLGRVLGIDKRNVLLDGWEKLAFRSRKAVIADLVAALAVEVVPPEPAAMAAQMASTMAAATPVPVAEGPDLEGEIDDELEDDGLDGDGIEGEEQVDETRPEAGEASPEVQAARVRWLKAHAIEVVRRVRSAHS